MFVTGYHKSQARSDAPLLIPRFFPAVMDSMKYQGTRPSTSSRSTTVTGVYVNPAVATPRSNGSIPHGTLSQTPLPICNKFHTHP